MPICPGCGFSYENTFNFCPQCGRPKPEEKKVVVTAEVKMPSHDFDCPLCNDASAVQKVSAIVRGGTSESRGSSTSSGLSNVYLEDNNKHVANAYSTATTNSYQKSQSSLAKKLTLPDPPDEPKVGSYAANGCWSWGVGAIVFVGVSILLLRIDAYNSLFDSIGGGFVACGLWIFVAAIATGIAFALVDYASNQANDTKGKFKTAMDNYQNELQAYLRVQYQWNELYYCHKHDVVYTPKLRKAVPVDQAISACYTWAKTGRE